ncbi:MAG: DegT/DnrJ/EryC1/StrS family aminotransferase [Candidatus Lokiarchaeia archaeon]
MDWEVRYIDYPTHFKKMEREFMDAIHTVLSRGDLILRQQLRDFEANLTRFIGTQYAVGVSNCTDALHLSLRVVGVGPGDEVITVSHTFVATVEVIIHVGAKPILIDIAEDHNMNIELIESAITPKTKAIIPVHLNGRLCDMGKIMAIAKKHNLVVIEDSAQALGASFKGTKGGAFGDIGCFSFYPAKLLGAFGDAGAAVTNSKDIADGIRLLRDHGRGKAGEIEVWGFNCRLDNLQAAILDLKLQKIPEWIIRRREIANIYHQGLSEILQLKLPPPPVNNGAYFDVFQNYEVEAEKRDELTFYLRDKRIETMLPWRGKGVHQFKALGLTHFKLPRTEKTFKRALMLPMYPELTNEKVEYVIGAIKSFYKDKRCPGRF